MGFTTLTALEFLVVDLVCFFVEGESICDEI